MCGNTSVGTGDITEVANVLYLAQLLFSIPVCALDLVVLAKLRFRQNKATFGCLIPLCVLGILQQLSWFIEVLNRVFLDCSGPLLGYKVYVYLPLNLGLEASFGWVLVCVCADRFLALRRREDYARLTRRSIWGAALATCLAVGFLSQASKVAFFVPSTSSNSSRGYVENEVWTKSPENTALRIFGLVLQFAVAAPLMLFLAISNYILVRRLVQTQRLALKGFASEVALRRPRPGELAAATKSGLFLSVVFSLTVVPMGYVQLSFSDKTALNEPDYAAALAALNILGEIVYPANLFASALFSPTYRSTLKMLLLHGSPSQSEEQLQLVLFRTQEKSIRPMANIDAAIYKEINKRKKSYALRNCATKIHSTWNQLRRHRANNLTNNSLPQHQCDRRCSPTPIHRRSKSCDVFNTPSKNGTIKRSLSDVDVVLIDDVDW